ncbi:MAG TPA: retropepsin-like aspartic protease [Terriglobales bacterium]|nr:retropepsin-like aspartic protease [Terriglobales bacterium]
MTEIELRFTDEELRSGGPRIQVALGPSAAEYELAELQGSPLPPPLKISALIDTGASITVINPKLAETRKLQQTGSVQLSAAGNQGKYPVYVASLSFPGQELRSFEIIQVVGCQLPQQPISCLIGRDVLRRWLLTYNGRSATIKISD